MATFAFAGGVSGTKAYGQQSKVKFVGTWADGDSWTVPIEATLSGSITVGKGNIAGQDHFCGFKLRDRMFVGFDSSFAMSQIADVTKWETQDTGAAVISFLSQFGPQDTVCAFASFEGKLVVFGALSTQIWQIDADPSQFVLLQTLANTGTTEPLSVKSVGDLDVYFLDSSGVRSIKAKEQNLNAYVNDVGTAVDSLISAAKRAWDLAHFVYFPTVYDGARIPAVIEPFTKQYWISFDDTTYVLSVHPQSKILAWSTFKNTAEVTGGSQSVGPTYEASGTIVNTLISAIAPAVRVGTWYEWTAGANDTGFIFEGVSYTAPGPHLFQITQVGNPIMTMQGTALAAVTATVKCLATPFSPQKHVVYNARVYTRTTDGDIYRYSGETTATYDRTIPTVELPWLDLGDPTQKKQGVGLQVAMSGAWTVQGSLNPKTDSYTTVLSRGSTSSPDILDDSTFDLGNYSLRGHGSHVKIKAFGGPYATTAKLARISITYQPGER
jgi:hypothetical protein